jgi:hypothetical protein
MGLGHSCAQCPANETGATEDQDALHDKLLGSVGELPAVRQAPRSNSALTMRARIAAISCWSVMTVPSVTYWSRR